MMEADMESRRFELTTAGAAVALLAEDDEKAAMKVAVAHEFLRLCREDLDEEVRWAVAAYASRLIEARRPS